MFVRHAKSSWTDTAMSDYERPLDSRGLHDAPLMAGRLKNEGCDLQLLITSSANRAKTTAKYFAEELRLPLEETRDLYHGMPEDYLARIHELNEDIRGVAFFGHNPGITYVANMIEPDCTDNIPTCGIIIARADETYWKDVDLNKMELVALMYPKDGGHV